MPDLNLPILVDKLTHVAVQAAIFDLSFNELSIHYGAASTLTQTFRVALNLGQGLFY